MPKIDALPSGSSSQRDGLNHQAIEDYLKTIYMLAEEESPVSTSRIADAREVKPASVTSMLRRLAKLKLVSYEKHRGVELTQTGEKVALEVIRHHRLLELYLMEALGFAWDEVHEQADALEHVISEKLEERIAAFLGNPTIDPHGDPIPAKDGTIIADDMRALPMLSPGAQGQVARIMDDANSEMLRYLADLGLIPGVKIEIMEKAPFGGPITLLIGAQSHTIGRAVAESVLVTSLTD